MIETPGYSRSISRNSRLSIFSAVTRPFSQGPDRKLLVTVPDAWMATHSRV